MTTTAPSTITSPTSLTTPEGATWPLRDGKLLVLRTCSDDLTSYGGFRWPDAGSIEAPDWDPDPALECGGGLHGLLWGCGNAQLLNTTGRWLVVAVDPADVANVDQVGKIRFKRAEIVLVSAARDDAISYLRSNGADLLPIVFGTATAGYAGTATAGDAGTATAGYAGTATAGYAGTATAGDAGTATAGTRGILSLRWWDASAERYRLTVGYVGEDDIEADVAYRLNDAHELVKVDQ